MNSLLDTVPMPKFPIFRLRNVGPPTRAVLHFYGPVLSLSGLQLGVDNLRYDVFLSPRACQGLSLHLARYIRRFGEVDSLLEMESPGSNRSLFPRPTGGTVNPRRASGADLKSLLVELHLAILSRAKVNDNPSVDVLGRLAILKFIRTELHVQFAKILEQCRMKCKSLEGLRQAKMLETRELIASFQVCKKIILRKAGQEVFRILREIEKETLARTRRSLLGEVSADTYRLFLNPLIFTEDGRDDYLCAEHYYMFGNFEKDPDRFSNLRRLALEFLEHLGYTGGVNENDLELALNVPENATALAGTGTSDEATGEERGRKIRLEQWTRLLQQEGLLSYVIASYEAVPLLSEYAPRVNPQQLKNALLFREETERVEKIIAEAKLFPDRLFAAIGRVASCRGDDRNRIAARLLRDLFCYHRDLRGLEALTTGFDSINLVTDDKVRELSSLNGMLYEFLPPEDQRPTEERVLHHVIIKADVRDSCRLTRSLNEKSMNAASYFSLNFYEPVNKLLAKYGAAKVFLEGDAIILALLDREGEAMLSVSRACVLANEILSLLGGYNELLERAGLPRLEVGLGIANQDSAPLYLMDGEHRIMISDAINDSDRLSSCNKRVRKKIASDAGVFQVYSVLIGSTEGAESGVEELRLNYNVGGICLSETAFRKMQQEISLTPWPANFTGPWVDKRCEFFVGTVPLDNGTFRRLVVRKSRIAQVDVRNLSILGWTNRYYYEVCANPAVEAALPGEKSSGAGNSK